MNKIKFRTGASSPFFKSLNNEVENLLGEKDFLVKAKRLLWIKAILYILLFIICYACLLLLKHENRLALIINYVLLGISGILLAFNVSHDACHGSFSKNKAVNYWLYHLTFNLQGTNAYLWKIRHVASHHVFPNVDGCDADIDNNPFIRLSVKHPLKKWHRFQHLYAFLVYSIYTLHWFLFKDLFYLFKKNVANLQNKKHRSGEKMLLFFWKLLYLFMMIIIPVFCGYDLSNILVAFFIMHFCSSLFFIHVLIATHLSMETQFPVTDDNGILPGDYYTHQLATSLDYSPTSKLYNWFFGGFNAHAAHHLYHKLPHTAYPAISVLIKNKAKEFRIQYNELSMFNAICSHYRFLKVLGKYRETRI